MNATLARPLPEEMETATGMYLSRAIPRVRHTRMLVGIGPLLVAMSLAALSGCSSGKSAAAPQVGPIVFADANGTAQTALTALTVNQGTYLEVTLPSDPKLLGADWSVSCGSALAPGTPLPPGQTQDVSCGTFTPAHTMSGPVPSYASGGAGYVTFYTAPTVPPEQGIVTLYATATSNPTKFSSVTLAINGLPLSVGFAPDPPPSVGLSSTAQFRAVLNNDVTGAGVNWTVLCSSADCGSFNPKQTASGIVTTYTSPATVPTGGVVKVTATAVADPTQSVSAAINILPINVSISPAVVSVDAGGTTALIATVSDDGLNQGVDWSVSCTNATVPGSCGTITPHTASGATATYTAPDAASILAGTTVNIVATSTADASASATSVATIVQGTVAMIPSENYLELERSLPVTGSGLAR